MTKTVSAYDLYATDRNLEASGVWVQIGPMRFKLARAGGGNNAFKNEVTKRFKPFQSAIANNTLPEDLAQQLVVDVFVDTVLLDWENVVGRDGQPIVFSKESAKQLLSDLPNLFTELQAESQKSSNFRGENLEAAAGN